MKILKNRIKSKQDGFNVWDVYTNISELLLIAFVVAAILLLTFQPNLIDIKKP